MMSVQWGKRIGVAAGEGGSMMKKRKRRDRGIEGKRERGKGR